MKQLREKLIMNFSLIYHLSLQEINNKLSQQKTIFNILQLEMNT